MTVRVLLPLSMENAMDEAFKSRTAALSRRSIMRNFTLTVGGAAMVGKIIGGNRVAEAQTKMAQSAVAYQDTPHDPQRCDNCLQWVPPSSCKTVQGNISPSGWCNIYIKKPD